MMNTLANHGFLHRDGLNLTEDVVIKALEDGLNFDNSLSKTMFKMALPANPDPNATWFTLYVLPIPFESTPHSGRVCAEPSLATS